MNTINELIISMDHLCEKPAIPFGLNTTITKYLGLLAEVEKGLQAVTFDLSTKKANWSIQVLTKPIKVTFY